MGSAMTPTKTVLFFESSKNMGGQEWQLLQQMQALQAQGYRCVLVCHPESRIVGQAKQRELATLCLPFRNSAHPQTIRGIVRALKHYQPQACVCHSGHDANNLSIAALLVKPRPKIIRSRTYYTNDKKKRWQSLLPLDVVMVPSRFMQRHIQNQFPSKTVEVVYPGVDFAKLDQQQASDLPVDLQQWLQQHGHGEVVIQVGMLRHEKGQHIVLEALAQLRQTHPNVAYIMAGGGNNTALKAQIGHLGLGDRVWLGELKAVAPAMLQAAVLVMPSLKEPLGMAQIEALGLGVPVIVSGVGGLPETVTHQQTGLIVTDATPEAWAQAIGYALAHRDEMLGYAQQGQRVVRQQFGMEHNTAQLLHLIAG